jgi:anthranilate synthase component 1
VPPRLVPLLRELDVAPAVLRALTIMHPQRYPLLLESAAAGPLSQASILLAEPSAALWQEADGRLATHNVSLSAGSFLAALDEWYAREHSACFPSQLPGNPWQSPFAGGWALFFGYELAQEVEPRLQLPTTPLPWRAFALRTHAALVHDLPGGRVYALAESGHADLLERLVADARRAAGGVPTLPAVRLGRVWEEEPPAFIERVLRAKEYVAAGDIYQANLSRPWQVELAAGACTSDAAAALYERLCRANPAPFAAFAQWQGVAILSSSPERLVRLDGRRIDTRPIAGTRPRSRRPEAEQREMAALAAHPKERAEHIMLIDLERNDLGRVCEAGSVRVDELMSIESYQHVHHIVSNVSGTLRPDVTPVGAVRAVFPGGTITGCPKFRCMQIIAELEAAGRGAYTGALGYLSCDGRLDLNILIRTMTLRGRSLTFRAGAGIVADSQPQRELEETRAKAQGLLAALGQARG